ncbi:MAG: DedA family protein [Acidobacteria bacterium]|nr:DedA family protein [Acidobacteriota bacterium]
MEYISWFIDFVLHLDKHLIELVQQYGTLSYGILFLIIFCETGLVVTPFLPGDSLLFAIGALSAKGALNVYWVYFLLSLAAILGDSTNYWIGYYLGPKVFKSDSSRWLNRRHLVRTHEFYEKYGGKTIIFARFMPIIRTFAPFVAGIGQMNYLKFLFYSVTGTIFWIGLFVTAGYWFANQAVVQENFSLVVVAIIIISLIPAIIEVLRARRSRAPGTAAKVSGAVHDSQK